MSSSRWPQPSPMRRRARRHEHGPTLMAVAFSMSVLSSSYDAVRVSFSIALITGMTRIGHMPTVPLSSIGASISSRRRVYASKLSPSTG